MLDSGPFDRPVEPERPAMPRTDPKTAGPAKQKALAELIRRAEENPGVAEVVEAYAKVQRVYGQAYPYFQALDRSVVSLSDHTSAA
jgi:hypothetical protein